MSDSAFAAQIARPMTTEPSDISELYFSGRDAEVGMLTLDLQDCLKGRGRTVFIAGEAGIGKTRLVDEVITRARESGFQVLNGRCLPGTTSPYLPFEEALGGFFKIALDDSDSVTERKISQALRHDGPEIRESLQAVKLLLKGDTVVAAGEQEGLAAWLRGTRQDKKLGLREWLRGPKPEAYRDYISDISRARSIRERFLQVVSSLVVQIADKAPVLLFIDDLQWADPSSLALLHLLSRRTRESRALIIGAYRSEEASGPTNLEETLQLMSRENLSVKIELKPLGKQDLSNILRKTFQSEFDSELVDSLYEEAEGNPLFSLETLRLLLEEGAIRKKEGAWVLGLSKSKMKIPSKVKDVLLRRVGRLMEEDRRILEVASVIGEKFESATIQEILALNKVKLLQSLSSMERIHSLVCSDESGYRFSHSKVREVVYDQLTPELRDEYHLLVAEWMEKKYSASPRLGEVVPALADHFFRGRQWDKALTYHAMAGDMAMQIHAHQEALESYSKALEALRRTTITIPTEISSSLQERTGLAAMATGKIDHALAVFDTLAETTRKAGNEQWYGRARLLHGWASFWNKDLEKALQDCSEALKIGREMGDKTLEARSLYLTGTSMLAKGLREQARAWLQDSLRASREAKDRVSETQTLLVLLMEGMTQ